MRFSTHRSVMVVLTNLAVMLGACQHHEESNKTAIEPGDYSPPETDLVGEEAEEASGFFDYEGKDAKDGTLNLLQWLKTAQFFAGDDDGNYVFDPQELHDISMMGIGLPREEMFDVVQQELINRYPGKIVQTRRWILNDAGTALGQLTILYASFKEYLIFFGSPIGNDGFSGRYEAEFWDFMMEGEMWTFVEGDLERQVYLPGDAAHLAKGQAKGYRIINNGWMLEYSRGNILSLFTFGIIAPAMFVTLDWEAAYATIEDFTSALLMN